MENLMGLIFASLLFSIPLLLIVRRSITEIIRTLSRNRQMTLAYRESIALIERSSGAPDRAV
jgi:hypothetical protein